MAAVPGPLPPAEAEALVQALQSTELRDIGGQGCGDTVMGCPRGVWGREHERGALNLGGPLWGCERRGGGPVLGLSQGHGGGKEGFPEGLG